MNNTMKRRMIAFVAAIAAVVSLSGCDDNYDETGFRVALCIK